jgi:hypothetical protein
MAPHDASLETACDKRDALVDRILATKDYRENTPGRQALIRYLSGHRHSNPNGIPTQLRQAQEAVLELMDNEVALWRT